MSSDRRVTAAVCAADDNAQNRVFPPAAQRDIPSASDAASVCLDRSQTTGDLSAKVHLKGLPLAVRTAGDEAANGANGTREAGHDGAHDGTNYKPGKGVRQDDPPSSTFERFGGLEQVRGDVHGASCEGSDSETAPEHIRNALQLIDSCAISPNAAFRLYSFEDLLAIRRRLNLALGQLEETALPDGARFELTEAGANALTNGHAREFWLAAGLRAVARLSALLLVFVTSCSALDAIGPKPPAKICPARDSVRLDSLPSTVRVVRGCP